MGKIIAIANQKGGVGKTTTTVNLATCLADLGKKVMVIDLDPQGNSTTCFGINKGLILYSISDVFNQEATAIQARVHMDKYHVDIIPATIELNSIEQYLSNLEDKNEVLYHRIKDLKKTYDYVLIDCSPTMGLVTINALYAADSILIPVQCHFLAMDGLTQLCNTIKVVQKNKKAKKRDLAIEGVVITMLDKRSKEAWKIVSEVKQYFGDKVMNTIITNAVAAQVAPSYGTPLVKYKPRCTVSSLYRSLALELLKNNEKKNIA